MQVRAVRWSVGLIGVLLVALNAFHLTLGMAGMRQAVSDEAVAPRIAEALAIAWVYMGCINLILGLLLLWLIPDLSAGRIGAWKAAIGVGAALVVVGVASFVTAGSHPGLLLFSLFGLVVLGPLIALRGYFA